MALSQEELQFYRDCAERGMTTREVSDALEEAGFQYRSTSAIYCTSVRHNINFRYAHGKRRPTTKRDAEISAKVLRTFWHNSRKVFVPQMNVDVARISGLSKKDAARALGFLLRGRMLGRSYYDGESRAVIYDLTAAGKDALSKIVAQEITETRAEKACSSLLDRRATTPGDDKTRRRGAFQANGDAHANH